MAELTVNKRRRCDAGCGYDKTLSQASPKLRMSHQEQEALFAELKFPNVKQIKNHKHHYVNESWVEVVGLK